MDVDGLPTLDSLELRPSLENCKLNVRADTEPMYAEKVAFTLRGPIVHSSIERVYPYALFGDVPSQHGSASDVVNVVHEGKTEDAHMVLLDVNGNVLLRRNWSKSPVEKLDVSEFRNGVYYLKVLSNEGSQLIRLVLE